MTLNSFFQKGYVDYHELTVPSRLETLLKDAKREKIGKNSDGSKIEGLLLETLWGPNADDYNETLQFKYFLRDDKTITKKFIDSNGNRWIRPSNQNFRLIGFEHIVGKNDNFSSLDEYLHHMEYHIRNAFDAIKSQPKSYEGTRADSNLRVYAAHLYGFMEAAKKLKHFDIIDRIKKLISELNLKIFTAEYKTIETGQDWDKIHEENRKKEQEKHYGRNDFREDEQRQYGGWREGDHSRGWDNRRDEKFREEYRRNQQRQSNQGYERTNNSDPNNFRDDRNAFQKSYKITIPPNHPRREELIRDTVYHAGTPEKTLGVEGNIVDMGTIKRAYHMLAREYSPDLNMDSVYTGFLQKINAAYKILLEKHNAGMN